MVVAIMNLITSPQNLTLTDIKIPISGKSIEGIKLHAFIHSKQRVGSLSLQNLSKTAHGAKTLQRYSTPKKAVR